MSGLILRSNADASMEFSKASPSTWKTQCSPPVWTPKRQTPGPTPAYLPSNLPRSTPLLVRSRGPHHLGARRSGSLRHPSNGAEQARPSPGPAGQNPEQKPHPPPGWAAPPPGIDFSEDTAVQGTGYPDHHLST